MGGKGKRREKLEYLAPGQVVQEIRPVGMPCLGESRLEGPERIVGFRDLLGECSEGACA